jgi:hypothetical protein
MNECFWKVLVSVRLGGDSSVGIATRYGLNGPWIESRGAGFSAHAHTGAGSTQPPVQWAAGFIPGG